MSDITATMADRLLSRRTTLAMLRAAYAVDGQAGMESDSTSSTVRASAAGTPVAASPAPSAALARAEADTAACANGEQAGGVGIAPRGDQTSPGKPEVQRPAPANLPTEPSDAAIEASCTACNGTGIDPTRLAGRLRGRAGWAGTVRGRGNLRVRSWAGAGLLLPREKGTRVGLRPVTARLPRCSHQTPDGGSANHG